MDYYHLPAPSLTNSLFAYSISARLVFMLFNQSPCSCFGCYFQYLFFLHILEWFTLFILLKIFIGPQPSLRPPRIISYPYTLSPPETPLCLVSFILLCRNCHFLHIVQFTYLLHSLFISPLSHPPTKKVKTILFKVSIINLSPQRRVSLA